MQNSPPQNHMRVSGQQSPAKEADPSTSTIIGPAAYPAAATGQQNFHVALVQNSENRGDDLYKDGKTRSSPQMPQSCSQNLVPLQSKQTSQPETTDARPRSMLDSKSAHQDSQD